MPKDGEFCKTFEIFRNLKKNKNGGISKKGFTLLVIFEKIMFSRNFQKILRLAVISHFREKLTYYHHFSWIMTLKIQVGQRKILNNINHFSIHSKLSIQILCQLRWNRII